MRINSLYSSMNTYRQYTLNTGALQKLNEKLASGYKINRSADDAAGLAISEKMRTQYRGLYMASKNSSDAVSLVQTAEGALQESQNSLQRMRELAVQASSDTNSPLERSMLNKEFQQLIKEIDDTAGKTRFNDMGVIDGSYAGKAGAVTEGAGATGQNFSIETAGLGLKESGAYTLNAEAAADGGVRITLNNAKGEVAGETTLSADALQFAAGSTGNTIHLEDGTTVQFDAAAGIQNQSDMLSLFGTGGAGFDFTSSPFHIQAGANEGDITKFNIAAMDSKTLGIDQASIATGEDARKAIGLIDKALNIVSSQRADLGATQNRLEHKINNLDTSRENLIASESRIRDLDMAAAMVKFTQRNIQKKASISMLAQANANSWNVLSLLN